MATGWRIVPLPHAGRAFDGEGGRLYGGRWNSPGTPMIYASEHKSLAALEILVHNRSSALQYSAFALEFDDGLIERLAVARLPADWRQSPAGPATMTIGDQWVQEARSVVLAVPSVIIPEEWNILLNPAHPDFKRIRIGKASPFAFDPRLLK